MKLSDEIKEAMERLVSNADHVHKISFGDKIDSLTLSYLMRIEDLCFWAKELVRVLETECSKNLTTEGKMTKEKEIKFRDECAMRVLQGMHANSRVELDKMRKDIPIYCFQMAEEMLEEKKKRDEKLS